LREQGYEIVVGVDEVGRGAWAGPLAVGAAIVPQDRRVNGIRDSKMLPERDRERLFTKVSGWCLAWGVGMASETECDELGMSAAQRLAARRALEQLGQARCRRRGRALGLRVAPRGSRGTPRPR
jgi:ribonuclease HII